MKDYDDVAAKRIRGEMPWLFEMHAPKLPWWKRNWLYRTWKRYRLARAYGASKRKAARIGVGR